MLPFSYTYLISKAHRVFQKRHKDIQGFKKRNCFRKAGLNTSLVVSIVRTATSFTKIISREYKFHVPKRKMLISFPGGTWANFCWVCATGLSEPLPSIIVYHMANYRPHLSHFWTCKCNFRDPNLVTFT